MFWEKFFRRKKLSDVTIDETGRVIEPKIEEGMSVNDWVYFLREASKFAEALDKFLDEENRTKGRKNEI